MGLAFRIGGARISAEVVIRTEMFSPKITITCLIGVVVPTRAAASGSENLRLGVTTDRPQASGFWRRGRRSVSQT